MYFPTASAAIRAAAARSFVVLILCTAVLMVGALAGGIGLSRATSMAAAVGFASAAVIPALDLLVEMLAGGTRGAGGALAAYAVKLFLFGGAVWAGVRWGGEPSTTVFCSVVGIVIHLGVISFIIVRSRTPMIEE